MSKSNRAEQSARKMLEKYGYYDPDKKVYSFGEADSHALRALYMLAVGMSDLNITELISSLQTNPDDDDPPWKNN
ncbi:MAG: hypothetical protein GW941_00095 [Candidatus Pacebacteria bacterium]|nr:hypothetical protein [Candidatus Paceibacterota bacterium]NCQ65900.1 hypothetical protein [Candidatus Paceibacterota bacterium]NCS87008.1 hypothetical protein [Candidatus Paceibacterota bacterium]PIQ80695.1 MAG: hypothetical protein COV78_04090 [Candidatus Pacebacteria bacterium CG11_big_fil_rev_8_21_14_0_20_34_55]PJC43553.1 MAG: hypothetical protein CO039_03430 [Candidatus Pacebacteria bacterium CG_4_9_14_0_2_um_filter_34_50]